MRFKLAIILSMAATSSAYGKVDFSPLPLDKHIARCPIIVVGHIASTQAWHNSDTAGERIWDTALVVTAVLKGTPPKPLLVQWEQHRAKGLEPYPTDQDVIWLLMRSRKTGALFANRNDSRLPLSSRQQVEELIRKQAFAANLANCAVFGGVVQKVGKGSISRCIIHFADGGHECNDGAECIGGCYYKGSSLPSPGTRATGVCRRDTNPYGCFIEIKSGQTQAGMCKD